MAQDEQIGALIRALGHLPLEQREVFILYNQASMSFRAIAAQQRLSLRTVQSRYRYAIEKLRKYLHVEIHHGR